MLVELKDLPSSPEDFDKLLMTGTHPEKFTDLVYLCVQNPYTKLYWFSGFCEDFYYLGHYTQPVWFFEDEAVCIVSDGHDDTVSLQDHYTKFMQKVLSP
jgi:hypothetical protein